MLSGEISVSVQIATKSFMYAEHLVVVIMREEGSFMMMSFARRVLRVLSLMGQPLPLPF
jgi:hypothetical protein